MISSRDSNGLHHRHHVHLHITSTTATLLRPFPCEVEPRLPFLTLLHTSNHPKQTAGYCSLSVSCWKPRQRLLTREPPIRSPHDSFCHRAFSFSCGTTTNRLGKCILYGHLFLPTLLFLSLISFSVAGFNVALSQIDVSVAYALWSALGTVIVSTAGVLFFNESCDAIKLTCIALIIVGVVGLNVRETHG